MNREKLLASLGVLILRLLYSTIRLRWNDHTGFTTGTHEKPVVLCFWHNRILGATLVFTRRYPRTERGGFTVLTSPSRDGGILAGVAHGLGMNPIRGSSSRRGAQALRELIRLVQSGHDVAITPDGPRGPRYSMGPGAILLAQSTGSALVLVHAKFSNAIRLKTWDGFIIPLPFSRICVTADEMIPVPRKLTAEAFEALRLRAETRLKNEAN